MVTSLGAAIARDTLFDSLRVPRRQLDVALLDPETEQALARLAALDEGRKGKAVSDAAYLAPRDPRLPGLLARGALVDGRAWLRDPRLELAFDPAKHPHEPAGSSKGGEWASTGVSFTPSPGFVEKMRADLDGIIKKAGSILYAPDAAVALVYREPRGNDRPEIYAMVEKMYAASGGDWDATLRAVDNLSQWNTGYAALSDEYAAATALGANPSWPKGTKAEGKRALTDAFVAAVKARVEFARAWVRAEHGDEVTVFRGVKGAQAKKIWDNVEGRGPNGEVPSTDLKVHALSSWATDKASARKFTSMKSRVSTVLEARIKTDDVWISDELIPQRVINFSDDHGEIVVASPGPFVRAKLYAG